ncbi:RNA-binding protein [Ameyamaea chiangmaiensis]|uniref:RNA-binding protein n=1 Tax=Ameyamaea chiangmaiensis TaxID=442969 RepID=UPI001FE86C83
MTTSEATHQTPPEPEDAVDNERGPERRCIVTRAQGRPQRMIRFVVGPDRQIVPDLAGRLPGRGMWLSARPDVLETARRRGAFARAARQQVAVPDDILQIVLDGLARRRNEALGLLRRSGQVVAGFVKAREWVVNGRAALVVQAADGSPDERGRLLSGARQLPVVEISGAAELGALFGRDHVVHAAVAHGALAQRLLNDNERFLELSGRAVPVRQPNAPDEGEQAGT